FNPTYSNKDDYNVILFIKSKLVSNLYRNEFEELWSGIFGSGKVSRFHKVFYPNGSIEVYFCPEDSCSSQLIEKIDEADRSIYFMVFTFTHPGIAEALVRAKSRGVEVKGIIERFGNNKWSKFTYLSSNNVNVKFDDLKTLLHVKVFIIDNQTVITGSFNPTLSADKYNDENLVIINDKTITRQFLNKFDELW
ncbi:MAG: phospholipase, partial [Candidatus Aenigmarchaeota archaeon]|nr:phospholipase [Candidatus Aenigmarchaeota archaeon]